MTLINPGVSALSNSKPVRLAQAALEHVRRGNQRQGEAYVRRIVAECNQHGGMYLAILAWCDAYTSHSWGAEVPPALPVRQFQLLDADTLEEKDDVAGNVRWAGDIVRARASLDQEAFTTAIDELAALDHMQRGVYVFTLLFTVGQTMRDMPYGYARKRYDDA